MATRVPLSWLREYIDIQVPPQELANRPAVVPVLQQVTASGSPDAKPVAPSQT